MAVNQKLVLFKTRAGYVHAALETTTLTVVKNVSDVLSQIISKCPITAELSHSDRLFCSIVAGRTWFIKQLSELKLRANYALKPVTPGDGNAKVTISWHQDRNILDTQLQLVWPVPAGVYLWFMSYDQNYWYLVAACQAPATAHDEEPNNQPPLDFYKLPLGNLHHDCAICMGDGFKKQVIDQNPVQTALDMVTFMNAATFYLDDTIWNSDLMSTEDMARAGRLFQWELPDLKPVPVTKEIFLRNVTSISDNLNWGPGLTDVHDKFYR